MPLRTDTIPNSLCLQVHMVFRVQVCVNGQRLHNEDLLFARFYVSEDDTCDLARTWGCSIWFGGRLSTMCISPHFSFWHGRQKPFLADMLDLWPPADLIPCTAPSHEDREEAYEIGAWTLT